MAMMLNSDGSSDEDVGDGCQFDLSSQELDTLPPSLQQTAQTAQITCLNLSRNNLTGVPDWFPDLSQLVSLDLSNNDFEFLPLEICSLVRLRHLCAKNNRLDSNALPKQLSQLRFLQELNLSGNLLKTLPPQLLCLTQLRKLYLGSNQLEEVPRRIAHLSQLEVLYLGGNRLNDIPVELGLLERLVSLNLSDNQLETLPSTMGNLCRLRALSLHNNRLQFLPQEIIELSHLEELSLRNNPLVVNFVRNLDWQVPTLLELSGRAVLLERVPYSRDVLPDELVSYLSSARMCVNPRCRGVYFSSRSEQVQFVDFCGKFRLPLLQFLCSPDCSEANPKCYFSESDSEGEEVRMRKVLLG